MEEVINLSNKIIFSYNNDNEIYIYILFALIAFFVIFISIGYNCLYTNETIHYPVRRRNGLNQNQLKEILKNINNE